jgi:trehalose/maltose hydrolase-like predicted phosphorylase
VNLWHVNENTFDATPKRLHSQETVFTIGNGYFATRGTFEEGYPRQTSATLLFGVFDAVPIAKEELANAPDWTVIQLFVNGERFRLDRGTILDYQRTLNLQNGVLSRNVHWQSPTGTRLHIATERFASLADEHVGTIRYHVSVDETPDGQPAEITLRSAINTAQGNYNLMHWETVDQGQSGNQLWLLSETKKSQVQLAQSMSFNTDSPAFKQEFIDSDIAPSIHLSGKLAPGATLTAEKVVVMYTTRDGVNDPTRAALEHHQEIISSPNNTVEIGQAQGTVPTTPAPQVSSITVGTGLDPIRIPTAPVRQPVPQVYDTLLISSQQAWQQFWDVADVILEGDEKAQIGLRFNLYQLRINASSHDDRYSIAAKGLTGFGYRGHVFHDTEIFMLPFFTYVLPEFARNLLLYRYHLLPAARKKAASNGYEGAQYPWESTLNGAETTPPSIIHPETGEVIPVLNGFIEIHITASIAHAVWNYWRMTGDDDFMIHYGTEIMLSTAQLWASRVEKNDERDDYEITNVIGPDEWHEHVNNNAFTNYMAKKNIQRALEAFAWLHTNNPRKARELEQQLNIDDQHLKSWQEIQNKMYIPQGKEPGLIEQFEGFFKLAFLDQDKYKGRKDSYQGIVGVEEVQKYQIVKQADVLMLLTVLLEDFDRKTKEVNWNYYYPITDHDYGSSLTPALHVILASELGYTKEAYELFMKGALVDLENLRGNAPEGIHAACSGAVWQAVILGAAGLRVTEEGYTTNPVWLNSWTRLAFHFKHKGELISVDLRKE